MWDKDMKDLLRESIKVNLIDYDVNINKYTNKGIFQFQVDDRLKFRSNKIFIVVIYVACWMNNFLFICFSECVRYFEGTLISFLSTKISSPGNKYLR